MTEPHEQAATVVGTPAGIVEKITGRRDDAALDGPADRQKTESTRGTSKLRRRRWGIVIVIVAVWSATFVAIRARTAPAPPAPPVVENIATR